MYGVIGSTTRRIKKLYGTISSTTRKIKKIYGVVGGVTRLVFSGNSLIPLYKGFTSFALSYDDEYNTYILSIYYNYRSGTSVTATNTAASNIAVSSTAYYGMFVTPDGKYIFAISSYLNAHDQTAIYQYIYNGSAYTMTTSFRVTLYDLLKTYLGTSVNYNVNSKYIRATDNGQYILAYYYNSGSSSATGGCYLVMLKNNSTSYEVVSVTQLLSGYSNACLGCGISRDLEYVVLTVHDKTAYSTSNALYHLRYYLLKKNSNNTYTKLIDNYVKNGCFAAGASNNYGCCITDDGDFMILPTTTSGTVTSTIYYVNGSTATEVATMSESGKYECNISIIKSYDGNYLYINKKYDTYSSPNVESGKHEIWSYAISGTTLTYLGKLESSSTGYTLMDEISSNIVLFNSSKNASGSSCFGTMSKSNGKITAFNSISSKSINSAAPCNYQKNMYFIDTEN